VVSIFKGGEHTDTFTKVSVLQTPKPQSMEPHTRLRGHPLLRSSLRNRQNAIKDAGGCSGSLV
jgi:hypothetical protein